MNEKADLNRAISQAAKRHPTQEPARIQIYGKKEILFCRMTNLSATGAFFEILNSNYTPRIGERVSVTVNLKKVQKSHTLTGQVAWSKGSGLGIAFIKQNKLIYKTAPKSV